MKHFYSPSKRGFFSEEIHGDKLPEDAIEVSPEDKAALLTGHSEGKEIVPGADGRPVLKDPQPPAPTWARVRERRNRLLAATDWTQLFDVPESLKVAWRPYRQALRDLPASRQDPAAIEWPAAPV